MTPTHVIKRDGRAAPFERARIAAAIAAAQHSVGIDDADLAAELARVVEEQLARACDNARVGIEEVQDAVIHVLQESGHYDAAIAFVRYRDARERVRRARRAAGDVALAPNLHVVDLDGRRRPWDRTLLAQRLVEYHGLDAKSADDALIEAEALLAESPATELTTPLFYSLVETALVRCGKHTLAATFAPLRLDRSELRKAIATASSGIQAVTAAGGHALTQLALAEALPTQAAQFHDRGRLWIDGLDDPRRGSRCTLTIDGKSNPWQVLTIAMQTAVEARALWKRVEIVLPASILGHLERGATGLVGPIRALAELATVFLYCDGRTPLLADWPFAGARVSIATYNDDFLLLRELQARRLPLLSGPHLMRGGYQRRVAVDVALNAQGLDGEHSQMDALAMAAASAVRTRLDQLGDHAAFRDAELRFAIFGLPPNSPSNDYCERQVVQEGLRLGLTLQRGAHLTEDACTHLARLLG
jgi:hypothetical protein